MRLSSALFPAASVLALSIAGTTLAQAQTAACLITKTDTNPFFVKMKEGATAKAEEMGGLAGYRIGYPA